MSRRPAGTIDLHLHTTASDGRCTPDELVARAARAGVAVLAVTDHDTTAAGVAVRAAAAARGLEAIPGIEITAIDGGRDVHVLGYFFDPEHAGLQRFLRAQRAARLVRVEAIATRLAAHGVPVNAASLVAMARHGSGRTIGRPQIARALVEAGHVASTNEAFDRWLERGRPGFVPRAGEPPDAVIRIIHEAGGVASLAHPGKFGLATRLPSLAAAGLDAVEVFHPDHDAALVAQYADLAAELGLLVTGGSDFHGDPMHGSDPGACGLPSEHWVRLSAGRG